MTLHAIVFIWNSWTVLAHQIFGFTAGSSLDPRKDGPCQRVPFPSLLSDSAFPSLHSGLCIVATPHLRPARGPCKARCRSAARSLRGASLRLDTLGTSAHPTPSNQTHTYPTTLRAHMHSHAPVHPCRHTHTAMYMQLRTATHTLIFLCRP